jgi:hypothetical protein
LRDNKNILSHATQTVDLVKDIPEHFFLGQVYQLEPHPTESLDLINERLSAA